MSPTEPSPRESPPPTRPRPAAHDVTGVVLAGGRGSRMGGVDKGLQLHRGEPLALHALRRLQPQVAAVLVNANRNLSTYEGLGVPVLADPMPDHPGPLAGLLAALGHCHTPWLASVPCDSPNFPLDLVARLRDAADAAQAPGALVVTQDDEGGIRQQPVFCLLSTALRDSVQHYLLAGERRILPWLRSQRCVEVVFADAAAFANINTLDDLRALD
jgi:molybdenum cofactor guanylyltransferase